LNAGQEDVREEVRPRPDLDGNKARLERSEPPTWNTNEPGPVPSWVQEQTGCRTRERLVEKYGVGARFELPRGAQANVGLGPALPLASRDALTALGLPERYLELARAYRDETGRWPYGHPLGEMKAGESIDLYPGPWVGWCRARAAAARPRREPPPKKGEQLSLV
jgi:hypothetical protein